MACTGVVAEQDAGCTHTVRKSSKVSWHQATEGRSVESAGTGTRKYSDVYGIWQRVAVTISWRHKATKFRVSLEAWTH